jgi:hypothetical protein
MELVAEEIEPLAVVVERQRARMEALQGQAIRVLPSGKVLLLDDSNGSDGDDHS